MGGLSSKLTATPRFRTELGTTGSHASSLHAPHSASVPSYTNVTADGPQRLVFAWSRPETDITAQGEPPAEAVRAHALVYLKYLDRSNFSRTQLLSSAVLPRDDFENMLETYCRKQRLRALRGMDEYAVFTHVVSEYGTQLDSMHSIIDWRLISSRLGLAEENDIAALKTSYHTHIAPIVAVWVMEVRLATGYLDVDAELEQYEVQNNPPFLGSLELVAKAIMAIADLLDLRLVPDVIKYLHLQSSDRGNNSLGSVAWLLRVADNDQLSLVACQLQGRACRVLIDWLYQILSRDDSVFRYPSLFRLYREMIKTSGDFPTVLWVPLDGSRPPDVAKSCRINIPHFFAGGFNLLNVYLDNVPYTACAPLIKDIWTSNPIAHQNFWRGIAILSVLKHPGLMPLRGVTATPSFIDIPPHRIAFLLPRVPGVDYSYPFSGPPPKAVEQVMIQIASALTYLHERGVVHGDLTWQNVIVHRDDTVSIWNLGFNRSRFDDSTERHRSFYQPPHRSSKSEPTQEDDICVCGLLFLSLAISVKVLRENPTNVRPPGATRLLSSLGRGNRINPPPEMPPYFADIDYMSGAQRVSLWQLTMDMIYDPVSLTHGMKDVLDHLETSFHS